MRFSHIDGLTPSADGGSGHGVKFETLALNITDQTDTQIRKPLSDYDLILFVGFVGDRNISGMFPAEFLVNHITESPTNDDYIQLANDSIAINFYFKNEREFAYYNTGANRHLREIIGIKF